MATEKKSKRIKDMLSYLQEDVPGVPVGEGEVEDPEAEAAPEDEEDPLENPFSVERKKRRVKL